MIMFVFLPPCDKYEIYISPPRPSPTITHYQKKHTHTHTKWSYSYATDTHRPRFCSRTYSDIDIDETGLLFFQS